MHLNSKNNQN